MAKYVVTLNGKNYEVEVEKNTAKITNTTAAAAPAAAPAPKAAPAPAPVPLPLPKRETKKQQNYSRTPNVNWGGVGVVGFLAGMLWLGAKIAAAPYTGGLSLVLP